MFLRVSTPLFRAPWLPSSRSSSVVKTLVLGMDVAGVLAVAGVGSSGYPKLIAASNVYVPILRKESLVLSVRLIIHQRLPLYSNQRVCIDDPAYSYDECCIDRFVKGYIRSWYGTVRSFGKRVVSLRYSGNVTPSPGSFEDQVLREATIEPCYLKWFERYGNVNDTLFACAASYEESSVLYSKTASEALNFQLQKHGLVGDLGIGKCECVPSCRSVDFETIEQNDLLQVRGGRRSSVNEAMIHLRISESVDEMSDIYVTGVDKLLGTIGGNIGLYLGFCALTFYTFTEKLLMLNFSPGLELTVA